MEGIEDGFASDTCFVCGLLYPEELEDDCPRCGRRMRYAPAAMMDATAFDRAIGRALAGYRTAAGPERREALADLLSLVHRFAAEPEAELGRAGAPPLAEIRREWEHLGGEHPGRTAGTG